MPHGTPHRRKGPGRFERESVSLIELTKMFPTERAARLWLEKSVWPDGPVCPYCGSAGRAAPKPNGPRTHRCSDRNCNRWFSVKTGSVMKALHLSCKQWAIGMHLFCCNLIGHSSLHRRRNFGMTQKSAWFLGHRLREAHQNCTEAPFAVPGDLAPDEVAVEVDEVSLGGSETNRHQRSRKGMRGTVADKAVFIGARNRVIGHVAAKVIPNRGGGHVRGFADGVTHPENIVMTDQYAAYRNLDRRRESVNHSVGQYVRGMAHVNGFESFWARVSAGYKGIFTKISKKHLQCYLDEFCHRHNRRTDSMDTVDMMKLIGRRMLGKRLR